MFPIRLLAPHGFRSKLWNLASEFETSQTGSNIRGIKKSIGLIVIVALAIVASAAVQSAFVANQKKVEDPVAELKSELAAFQKEVAVLVDAARNGAPAPQDAIQRFRDKIDGPRKKVANPKLKIPGLAESRAPNAPGSGKSLEQVRLR